MAATAAVATLLAGLGGWWVLEPAAGLATQVASAPGEVTSAQGAVTSAQGAVAAAASSAVPAQGARPAAPPAAPPAGAWESGTADPALGTDPGPTAPDVRADAGLAAAPSAAAPDDGSAAVTADVAAPSARTDLAAASVTADPPLAVCQVAPGTGPLPWISGAGGKAADDGGLATWRGRDLGIIGTWADSEAASSGLWQLAPGGALAGWTGPVDIAVGAFDAGGSWARAAAGDYDQRWRASLTKMATLRAGRGTTYIRFAHELNGSWYPWSVTATSAKDFGTAWARYRALQKEVFPSAKLVLSLNRETVGAGLDWRTLVPAAGQVDLLGVDYYNQYPYVADAAGWTASLDDVDAWGAPKGLAAHLDFARSRGLPLAINEWAGNSSMGDSPAFVRGMYDFLTAHGGQGAGQVAYEILFDVDQDAGRWTLYPTTQMPLSAEAYRALW